MDRREFIGTAAGLTIGGLASTGLGGERSPDRQLLELRLYRFASEAKRGAFEEFLARAAIPALNRAGIEPVGAFRMSPKNDPKVELPAGPDGLYVLLPHRSAESMVLAVERLPSDPVFVAAARGIIDAPKTDPAFLRFESTLMRSFRECPRVEVPTRAASRVLQLRIYESHCDERALAKIAMFDDGGEIALFRRLGMHPVFFGQSLVGGKLPNLTYMLGFEDAAAMDRAWAAFRNDPAWAKLRDDPAYKDTVSTVTNLLLAPSPASQV